METNPTQTQENIKANHRRDIWLKIVDHLNPSDLWDMTQKFLWQEGPIEFWRSRFYNKEKALELANGSVLCLRESVNSSVIFKSESDPKSSGGFSGLIMPSDVYLTYESFLPLQDQYNEGRKAGLIDKIIANSGGVDNILGFMHPGTFNEEYLIDGYDLAQFGVAVRDGQKLKVLRKFHQNRAKIDPKYLDRIYGGLVIYYEGRTEIVNINEIENLIQHSDERIKALVQSNFMVTREPGRDGYTEIKEIIDQVKEWGEPNHLNLTLRFETRDGIRYGAVNFYAFPFQKAADVIEQVSLSIGATSWTAMFGEYRGGGITFMNNPKNRDLFQGNHGINDNNILIPDNFNASLRLYKVRDYFIFKYR